MRLPQHRRSAMTERLSWHWRNSRKSLRIEIIRSYSHDTEQAYQVVFSSNYQPLIVSSAFPLIPIASLKP